MLPEPLWTQGQGPKAPTGGGCGSTCLLILHWELHHFEGFGYQFHREAMSTLYASGLRFTLQVYALVAKARFARVTLHTLDPPGFKQTR